MTEEPKSAREPDTAGLRLRLEAAQARLDEPEQLRILQLQRQRAGVDARELEEVVDERPERPHLLAQRGQVVLGLREAVLERLQHRLHVRERSAQVVARPGDELGAGVEELLEPGGHLVEALGQLGELALAGSVGAGAQVTRREPVRGAAQRLDPAADRAHDAERRGDGCGGSCGGDPEDGQVVLGVEHDEPGEDDRAERQQHGEQREPGELQAERRQPAEPGASEQARGERRPGHDEREPDHEANL